MLLKGMGVYFFFCFPIMALMGKGAYDETRA